MQKKYFYPVLLILVGLAVLFIWYRLSGSSNLKTVEPRLTLKNEQIDDQDDMCIWLHPEDPALSTIITSDKGAKRLFVYDLTGKTLQSIPVNGQPGNIDIRYNFPFGSEKIDIVGYNDRQNNVVVLYKIEDHSRNLVLLGSFDAGDWPEEIYGFCFYQNRQSGSFYGIAVGKSGQVRQWEIIEEKGTIRGIEKRTWKLESQTEGCVADDETGFLYLAEENTGIWKFNAAPDASTEGELIATVNRKELEADLEGITIYYAADGQGYLLISSQGNDTYAVLDRQPPHPYLTSFRVKGARSTDGIDVLNCNLGPDFPSGIFTLHNQAPKNKTVEMCGFEDTGLDTDTQYWNPRWNDSGKKTKTSSK